MTSPLLVVGMDVCQMNLLALPTKGKDIIVFRFIVEYIVSSLRDFGP
jgi:hypothetical protein